MDKPDNLAAELKTSAVTHAYLNYEQPLFAIIKK